MHFIHFIVTDLNLSIFFFLEHTVKKSILTLKADVLCLSNKSAHLPLFALTHSQHLLQGPHANRSAHRRQQKKSAH